MINPTEQDITGRKKLAELFKNNIKLYFFSFFIIFSGSVLVAFFSERSIRHYITQRLETECRNSIQIFNKVSEKMDLSSQMIERDSNFVGLVYSDGTDGIGTNILKLKAVNQTIKKVGILSEHTPYIFTLFQKSPYFVSSDQCSQDFDTYYQNFMLFEKAGENFSDGERLKQYLFAQQEAGKQFVSFDRVSVYINNRKVYFNEPVIYLGARYSFPGNTKYINCFLLEKAYFLKLFSPPDIQDKLKLCVADKYGGGVVLREGFEKLDFLEVYPRDSAGISGVRSHQGLLLFSAENQNIRIYLGLPRAYIHAQMRSVHWVMGGLLFAWLLGVIFLSLRFSYMNYQGVSHILLPEDTGPGKRLQNQYALIGSYVKALKEKDAEQIFELTLRNHSIELERMMLLGIQTEEEKARFEKLLGFSPEVYCIALVRYCHLGQRQQEAQLAERMTLMCRSELHTHYEHTVINIHSGINEELFLIELNVSGNTDLSEIEALFKNISVKLLQEFNISAHIGISAIGVKLENVRQCYQQARQIVDGMLPYENETRIRRYLVGRPGLYENQLTTEWLVYFENLLKMAKQEETHTALEKLCRYFERMPYLYELQKEQLFYSLRNVLYSVWLQVDVEGSYGVAERLFLRRGTNARELFAQIELECERIIEAILQKRRSRNERLREKMLQYLEQNFRDSELSAAKASTALGISEKYLFSFIKEQMGETFISYVTRLRIEEAKRLLAQTDMNNEKIAEQTGFGTANTFYRNFNRATGMTPRVYRENAAKA